jgi:hypothetical protein
MPTPFTDGSSPRGHQLKGSQYYETMVFYFFSASRISIIFRKIHCCSTSGDSGRVIEGNAGAGHNFGNAQLQRQRRALIAYLQKFI